jgi:acyl carrier protein
VCLALPLSRHGRHVADNNQNRLERFETQGKPMSQPDANQIFASLQQFLNERFDLEPTGLTREATLRSVGLDSMMVLDVMLEVEDRLGVKLDDMSLPKDATLGDVANLISRNLEKSSAP